MFLPAIFSDLKLISTVTVERNSYQLQIESVHSQRKTKHIKDAAVKYHNPY